MLRLMVSDLIANIRVWLGAFLVAGVTGAVGAAAASDIETALAAGGTVALALYAISGVIVAFTAVAALVVVGSVAGLTVVLQQRGYALWQLVGVRPAYVRAVVMAQLFFVGLLGAALGCVAAVPILGPLFRYAFAGSPDLESLRPRFDSAGAASVAGFVALVVTLGGARSAGRASRTPPVQSLREPEIPGRRMSVGRWVGGVLILLSTVGVVASLSGTGLEQLTVPLMLIGPLTAGALAAFGPLYLGRLVRSWTSLVPTTLSSAWYLARSNAAYNVGRSTATVSPVMVALALGGGLYAANDTVDGAVAVRSGAATGSLTTGSVVLLLGGPLLIAVLGATASIFMSGRRRGRELALVVAAGGTFAVVIAAAAGEAVIYVGTAVLLGLVAVAATGLVGGWAVHDWSLGVAPSFGLPAVGIIAAGSLLLILAATVIPTALSLRQEIPRTLAPE